MADDAETKTASAGEEVILPGKPERALKHCFIPKKGGSPEFRYCQGEWSKTAVTCVIDDMPFAEGAMRMCHRMQLVAKDGTRHNVVAKVSKDPNEDKNTYYRDVQAQACAKEWAREYNECNVPKQIDFVPAYVFELVDRPRRPLIGVEEFVEGVFQKHNNNVGGTVGDQERATPNAFSHFTWEASNHTILVCDIQGVNDLYTDPQIHTCSGKGFGRGNLGQAGLNAFLARHRCTHICELLGLPNVGNKSLSCENLEAFGALGSQERVTTPIGADGTGGQEDFGLGIVGQPIKAVDAPPGSPQSPEGREVVMLQAAPSNRAMLPPKRASADDDRGDSASSPEVGKLDKSDDALMDQILDELNDL